MGGWGGFGELSFQLVGECVQEQVTIRTQDRRNKLHYTLCRSAAAVAVACCSYTIRVSNECMNEYSMWWYRDLLEGIAERSGGVCTFVLDDKEIAAKCSYLKRAALASGALTK